MIITANDLKTKGALAIRSALSDSPSAFVSVRGQNKYVVMDITEYDRLREAEITQALEKAREEIRQGEYVAGGIDKHIKRIQVEL